MSAMNTFINELQGQRLSNLSRGAALRHTSTACWDRKHTKSTEGFYDSESQGNLFWCNIEPVFIEHTVLYGAIRGAMCRTLTQQRYQDREEDGLFFITRVKNNAKI